MASLLRSYTHKYDIRGKISQRFGTTEAYSIGKGFASILNSKGRKGPTVVVGRDVRDSSLNLASNLIQGFVQSGIRVLDIGVCTTPMLRFAAIAYEVSGSVMVTASHNSFEDNGFKFTLNNNPFYDQDLQSLCDLIDHKSFTDGFGSVTPIKVKDFYISNILKDLNIYNDYIRVVWIARNQFMSSLLEAILKHVPGQHMIHTTSNDFAYFKPDVIFDFDTDADRMILTDNSGKQWYGDETLTLFALSMKSKIPKLRTVFDLKSSRVLIGWLESMGIGCAISRIGSCFVDRKMKDTNAHVGGETSGHFMFADYNHFSDDGIYAALQMIHYLSLVSGNLQGIKDLFPQVHISKLIKITCAPETKFDLIERMKIQVNTNNLVISQNEENAILVQHMEGWYVIRASETENAISVRCEGFDKFGLDSIQSKAEELLSSVGLSLW